MKNIKIIIGKDGKVIIDLINYRGVECIREAEKIIEMLKKKGLNVEIKEREDKPELYEEVSEVNTEWIG